ncbi:MAG: hypothetical protein E6H88_03835 [Chloroflexi bacterium]|nr:MAG: hypothetical protein E6H88_03835 [Chloroflexota bacterium]
MAVLVWASRPGETERRLAAAASVIGAAFAVVLNLIFARLGVWLSTVYTLPPPVLASMLVLGTALMLLVLAGYRWLARRSRRAPLLNSLLLVVLAPLIVGGDTLALSQRYLAFGDGYTIWMDVVVGAAIFALPVLAFELLRSRGLNC